MSYFGPFLYSTQTIAILNAIGKVVKVCKLAGKEKKKFFLYETESRRIVRLDSRSKNQF